MERNASPWLVLLVMLLLGSNSCGFFLWHFSFIPSILNNWPDRFGSALQKKLGQITSSRLVLLVILLLGSNSYGFFLWHFLFIPIANNWPDRFGSALQKSLGKSHHHGLSHVKPRHQLFILEDRSQSVILSHTIQSNTTVQGFYRLSGKTVNINTWCSQISSTIPSSSTTMIISQQPGKNHAHFKQTV